MKTPTEIRLPYLWTCDICGWTVRTGPMMRTVIGLEITIEIPRCANPNCNGIPRLTFEGVDAT